MDLYRYFHPHHNPRLRDTPLRLQELGELEQAAAELAKAIKRAGIRAANNPIGPIQAEHFEELLRAANYLVESIAILSHAHPGDDNSTMEALLRERQDAPGWENWARLLKQRLQLLRQSDFSEMATLAPVPPAVCLGSLPAGAPPGSSDDSTGEEEASLPRARS